MNFKKNKKVPLQKYWTSRYVWTLTIGLIIVAIISAVWIRHNAFEKRINMMRFMAEETAGLIIKEKQDIDEKDFEQDFEVREFLSNPAKYMQLDSNPSIFVANTKGEIIYSNMQKEQLYQQLNPELLNTSKETVTFYSEAVKDKLIMVKAPIKTEQKLLGWVVFFELKDNLTQVDQEYFLLFIMIGTLGVLGWISIYLLSKRLAKPITDIASAAEKIKQGNYQVTLSDDVKEKEVHDLIQSFKEMALKLEQLEDLRSELLAGVTHELKTPITSISGLLQAIDEGVVEGEEAKEFIEISLKETAKMRMMVEDLLAFNAFAARAVTLNMEHFNLLQFLEEAVKEWNIHENFSTHISIAPDVYVEMDYIRLKQIFTNLFNNAKQAMLHQTHPHLEITGKDKANYYSVFVRDNGSGIAEEDQPYIFEKFYRGKTKKENMTGFGLGLPYSQLLAQAMGGHLQLKESNAQGTVFEVVLKKTNKKSI